VSNTAPLHDVIDLPFREFRVKNFHIFEGREKVSKSYQFCETFEVYDNALFLHTNQVIGELPMLKLWRYAN